MQSNEGKVVCLFVRRELKGSTNVPGDTAKTVQFKDKMPAYSQCSDGLAESVVDGPSLRSPPACFCPLRSVLSQVSHPIVQDTIAELTGVKAEVVLIHLNHTNPLLSAHSPERAEAVAGGFTVSWGKLLCPACTFLLLHSLFHARCFRAARCCCSCMIYSHHL